MQTTEVDPHSELPDDNDTSSMVKFARKELSLIGGQDDEMQDWMNDNLIDMVKKFASQGHSGFSASYAIGVLEKLLRYEALTPLTGKDDEWNDVSDTGGRNDGPLWQNNRCPHVFKDKYGSYDIDGKIFREPNGCCYTSYDSRVPVTFPYTPKREYVDVPFHTESSCRGRLMYRDLSLASKLILLNGAAEFKKTEASFSNSLPFKYSKGSKSSHSYKFESPSHNSYSVYIRRSSKTPNHSNVSFRRSSALPEDKFAEQILNDEPHQHRIFSTVLSAIHHHLKNNPHVTHVEFSAVEPSRVKLYHHMAKRLSSTGEYHHSLERDMYDNPTTHFLVPVRTSVEASFDKPFSFEHQPRAHGNSRYTFDSPSHAYEMHIRNNVDNISHVVFNRNDEVPEDKSENDILNDEPHSHKVFSTIIGAIRHHLKNNPHITHVSFSSLEPSRTKLYHHLAKRLSPTGNYESRPNSRDGDVNFFVPVRASIEASFNAPLPFDKTTIDGNVHQQYRFKSPSDKHYSVDIETPKNSPKELHSNVDFSRVGKLPSDKSEVDVLNDEPHSHRVFSTVHGIIKHHLMRNPLVTHITFSSHQPSRTKLYHHLSKRLSPTGEYSHDDQTDYDNRHTTYFKVPVRKPK
jgi:hypothetical protein